METAGFPVSFAVCRTVSFLWYNRKAQRRILLWALLLTETVKTSFKTTVYEKTLNKTQKTRQRIILLPSRLYCRFRLLTGSTFRLADSGFCSITAGREFHPALKECLIYLRLNYTFLCSARQHFCSGIQGENKRRAPSHQGMYAQHFRIR